MHALTETPPRGSSPQLFTYIAILKRRVDSDMTRRHLIIAYLDIQLNPERDPWRSRSDSMSFNLSDDNVSQPLLPPSSSVGPTGTLYGTAQGHSIGSGISGYMIPESLTRSYVSSSINHNYKNESEIREGEWKAIMADTHDGHSLWWTSKSAWTTVCLEDGSTMRCKVTMQVDVMNDCSNICGYVIYEAERGVEGQRHLLRSQMCFGSEGYSGGREGMKTFVATDNRNSLASSALTTEGHVVAEDIRGMRLDEGVWKLAIDRVTSLLKGIPGQKLGDVLLGSIMSTPKQRRSRTNCLLRLTIFTREESSF